MGKCRCLLPAHQRFAVLQAKLQRMFMIFRHRFGKSDEDRISKISMRNGESAISTAIDSTLD